MNADAEAHLVPAATSTTGVIPVEPVEALSEGDLHTTRSCGCFTGGIGCSTVNGCGVLSFRAQRLDLQGRHSVGARQNSLSTAADSSDLQTDTRTPSNFSSWNSGRCSFSTCHEPRDPSEGGSSVISSITTCDSSSCLLCQRTGASDEFEYHRKRSLSERLHGGRGVTGMRVSHSANDLTLIKINAALGSDSCLNESLYADMCEEEVGKRSRRFSLEWLHLGERSSTSQSWGSGLEAEVADSTTPVRAHFTEVDELLHPGAGGSTVARFARASSTTHVVQELTLSSSGSTLAGATRAKQVCLYDVLLALTSSSSAGDTRGSRVPAHVHSMPSRVSAMSWSPHHDTTLAMGDNDGVVWQMDMATGHIISESDEHDGDRVWSVTHSAHHATMLATSAGKGGIIKIWDMGRSADTPAFTIAPGGSRVPVCSVQFSPHHDSLVAAASADHSVYLYDLRSPETPLHVLSVHNRPVSYVRFMGPDRLVSSSVDGSVVLWRAAQGSFAPDPPCVSRVFQDHKNKRNFVGLSVDDSGLIACGSEDGAAYAYFPAWTQRVAATAPRSSSPGCFVTSVSWLRPQALGLSSLDDCPPILAVADTGGALKLHALIRRAGFQRETANIV